MRFRLFGRDHLWFLGGVFGVQHFLVFLTASIVFSLTPGPDTLYILGRSIAQGRRAGFASTLGISTGAIIHTLAAAFGLSALLASSPMTFTVVRWVGAAYLIYLGIRMVVAKSKESVVSNSADSMNAVALFRQGLLTNVLNPKVALFYLAFMPQFIAKDAPSHFLAFLLLGLTFVITGTLWCLIVATFAGSFGRYLRAKPSFEKRIHRGAGGLFALLGIRLLVTQ